MTGMVITHQDYINTATIILLYAMAGWILIGISALIVKRFWYDPLVSNQEVNVVAEYKQTRKINKVA